MKDIKEAVDFLKNYNGPSLNIMEVCGTHTAAISKSGIENIISDKINLISGPGCPVCVTVAQYIDKLCELAFVKNQTVVTFADMIRVPGSKISLSEAKSVGASIKMVYTPFEILDLAYKNPNENFIFAAIGFETTTPIYAVLLEEIINKNIKNIKLLTSLKTMPQVIEKLCSQNNINISGFIAPGHVSVITGSDIFKNLANKYSLPFVVSGFKTQEILAAIFALVKLSGKGKVLNLYKAAVEKAGNIKAQNLVNKYFTSCDAAWRGLGIIENSGMKLKDEYKIFDAGSEDLILDKKKNENCLCGKILTGVKSPMDCPLYKTKCNPKTPQGACMVSMEGTCFQYYINNK